MSPSLVLFLTDHHGTQDAIGNTADTLQLRGEVGTADEVVQDIVALGLVVDEIGQLTLAPLVDLAQLSVLLDQ